MATSPYAPFLGNPFTGEWAAKSIHDEKDALLKETARMSKIWLKLVASLSDEQASHIGINKNAPPAFHPGKHISLPQQRIGQYVISIGIDMGDGEITVFSDKTRHVYTHEPDVDRITLAEAISRIIVNESEIVRANGAALVSQMKDGYDVSEKIASLRVTDETKDELDKENKRLIKEREEKAKADEEELKRAHMADIKRKDELYDMYAAYITPYLEAARVFDEECFKWAEAEMNRLWRPWRYYACGYQPGENGLISDDLFFDEPKPNCFFKTLDGRTTKPVGMVRVEEICVNARPRTDRPAHLHRHIRAGKYVVSIPPGSDEATTPPPSYRRDYPDTLYGFCERHEATIPDMHKIKYDGSPLYDEFVELMNPIDEQTL